MQDTLSKGTARAAQLHLQRSPPAHSEDMPPEFPKTHVLYERSLHEASQARRVTRLPAQPRAWWCPQRANGRLLSVDVCVSVCSADGSYRPRLVRPFGRLPSSSLPEVQRPRDIDQRPPWFYGWAEAMRSPSRASRTTAQNCTADRFRSGCRSRWRR